MARTQYRDTNCPNAEHTVTVDGVRLAFDRDGLLINPTPAQVEAMTKNPYRRQRFVEEPPRSSQAKRSSGGKSGGVTTPAPPDTPDLPTASEDANVP